MDENTREERLNVYEIGYLVASSIPEEKVPTEAAAITKIATDAGAKVITEELPHRQHLSYTIRRKTVAGSYEKYDIAYFGWVKFELGSDKIEAVKKAIEVYPSVIRMLLTTTVAENTYLGKRAPVVAETLGRHVPYAATDGTRPAEVVAAPVTIEDMDKSIDEMVKEV